MSEKPIGLLVMAYGTPRSLEEVEPYYTHIRRGRAPTPELLAELIGRYKAIGGVSPLNEITDAQATGIEAAIYSAEGPKFRLYQGMKHASPFISEAIHQMVDDGIEEAITLVLAPHYSTMSVASYQKSANDAAKEFGGPVLHHIDSWHLEPGFIDLLAKRVHEAVHRLPNPDKARVIFTAHSLPERILEVNDPYPTQLHETGDAVAKKLGLNNYSFGWQSAGRTAEKWIGPDILDVLREVQREGEDEIVICPAGFVSDHLEVLYDVDIECQALAKELGIHLVRTRSLNAEPQFLEMLAGVVLRTAKSEVL